MTTQAIPPVSHSTTELNAIDLTVKDQMRGWFERHILERQFYDEPLIAPILRCTITVLSLSYAFSATFRHDDYR